LGYGEDVSTLASEATSLGTVDTFSAGEVAFLTGTILGVSVHTWLTDSTLGLAWADSAVGNSTSFTGVVVSEVSTWFANGALVGFFTEKTSSWALGTVTVSVSIVSWVTSVTLVNIRSALIVDLSNLTVGHIVSGTTDLGTGSTVLAEGKCSCTSEALGFGTDSAFSVNGDTFLANHSTFEFASRVSDQRVLGRALGATLVHVTSISTTVHIVNSITGFAGESSSVVVEIVRSLTTSTLVARAEATVGSGTGSTGWWVCFWIGIWLEVFFSFAFETHEVFTFVSALGTMSDTSSSSIFGSIALDDLNLSSGWVNDFLVTFSWLFAHFEFSAFADFTSGDAVSASIIVKSKLASDARVDDGFSTVPVASHGAGWASVT
jgi:hypothetical protein